MTKDHPIFIQSIQFIRSKLPANKLNYLENQVLERLIHPSGDFTIEQLLLFSNNACEIGVKAIKNGAPILTDTDMAAVAIQSMANQAHGNIVFSARKWTQEEEKTSLLFLRGQ